MFISALPEPGLQRYALAAYHPKEDHLAGNTLFQRGVALYVGM